MNNEELIEELLLEAETLRIREEVLNSMSKLLELNPKMERYEAARLSLDNVKLHSGLNKIK